MTTSHDDGASWRASLLTSARNARKIGAWNEASIAGWLLERAGGDARSAMLLDAPVDHLELARARSYLLAIVNEEMPAGRVGLSFVAQMPPGDADAVIACLLGEDLSTTDTLPAPAEEAAQ